MKQDGWTVHWKDSRKNITFENEDGKKVRDSNLSKTFNVQINKEILYGKFEGNREKERELERDEEWEREKAELFKYYDELNERLDEGFNDRIIREAERSNRETGVGEQESEDDNLKSGYRDSDEDEGKDKSREKGDSAGSGDIEPEEEVQVIARKPRHR